MLIQLCFELLILLFAVYYGSMFLHYMGVKIFKDKGNVSFWKSLIPFYYWIKNKPV